MNVQIPLSASLHHFGRGLTAWLTRQALPIWCSAGRRLDGAFVEALEEDARPTITPRRLRVQPRQVYVYAQAMRFGWRGPARAIIRSALEAMDRDHLRSDGLYRTLVADDGTPLDETAMIYDHAFILLALATWRQAAPDLTGLEGRAVALRERLLAKAMRPEGLVEAGTRPYQANAQMHLLEACQAWMRVGKNAGWAALADDIVARARTRFIDPSSGALFEFFDEAWRVTPQAIEQIEPGHQFEWATLLLKQGRLTGDASLAPVARRLFTMGERGLFSCPPVAVDVMNAEGPKTGSARFWPQTEWLKAALALAEAAEGSEREWLLRNASMAASAVELYLRPNGLWRDRRTEAGSFEAGPSPASSFYHLMAASEQFNLAVEAGIVPGVTRIDLS
ncbi:AGE family epimerase/isomerase [Brevundimonas sp.]|uniref:AGE family epimerase/isomerase n=1 Tax=Brevundimonas sp. TaxID=1871086 RepID=UPI0028A046AE|nr:AGE family epimerase/isomerase [Brevundimonas sp.]